MTVTPDGLDQSSERIQVEFSSRVPTQLAIELGDMARQLAADRSLDHMLESIVDSAARTVPRVTAAGISYLGQPRSVLVRAQSDPLVAEVDDLQTRLQQGPCLHVLTSDRPLVRIDDVRTDDRWPAFATAAGERGILSVLSFRLFVDDATLGNLSLFAKEAHAFDADSEMVGELFAAHASVALCGVRLEQQFNQAVRRRDVIGQAKGFLMARHDLDEETAFATLVRYSQTEHIKLYEVAERLLDSVKAERASGGTAAGT